MTEIELHLIRCEWPCTPLSCEATPQQYADRLIEFAEACEHLAECRVEKRLAIRGAQGRLLLTTPAREAQLRAMKQRPAYAVTVGAVYEDGELIGRTEYWDVSPAGFREKAAHARDKAAKELERAATSPGHYCAYCDVVHK